MSEIDRRKFIKGATGAATVAATMIGPKTWANANDKIRVGVAGLFGRGKSHLDGFENLENVEVTAICDADANIMRSRARDIEKSTGREVKQYQDMRQMFEDKDIDVVSFATPNHWHALGSIWAIQAGKDVYVEKPCSHSVWEGRKIVEAARKYDKIVQMGAQSRSNEGMREGIQKLHEGAIGEVYMAKGLCYKWRATIGSQPQTPPPSGLDYNLWSGPAEMKPFTRNYHPYKWHWFWHTGNGDIGNQGIHEMDKARWGLGVDFPSEVHAAGGKFMFEDDQETPNCVVATFKYPDQKKMLVFEVRHWITNPELGDGGNNVGNIFYGSEGYMIMPSYSSYQIFLGKDREPQPAVNKGGNHYQNFIDAVRARDRSILNCEIEEGHISSAYCHLANISHRLGRSFKFDGQTEQVIGDAEANAMLKDNYREPFIVPEKV